MNLIGTLQQLSTQPYRSLIDTLSGTLVTFFMYHVHTAPQANKNNYTTSARLPEAHLIAYYLREPPLREIASRTILAREPTNFLSGKPRTKFALVFLMKRKNMQFSSLGARRDPRIGLRARLPSFSLQKCSIAPN